MYKAEILADSLNLKGDRLTTMKITFPRFILAEMNTHRMFSRNSASSRAIPFKKMVKMVEENPFIPLAWQKDHKGMQGTEYIQSKDGIYVCKAGWLESRDKAIHSAMWLNSCNVTKQLCNRLLEPFMWHTVIVTATEWENFFKLRCPQYEVPYTWDTKTKVFRSKKEATKYWQDKANKDTSIGQPTEKTDLDWLKINKSQADIHIQAIAELMWDAINESTPKQLEDGEWHIPFGDNIEWTKNNWKEYLSNIEPLDNVTDRGTTAKIQIATARCARISYETLGDNPKIDYEADIKLHDRLSTEGHMSPFEHCAKAMSDEEYDLFFNGDLKANNFESAGWCRNFKGFIQYRHIVEKPNNTENVINN
jgi:thymidylate synthase ThyX